MPIFHPKLIKTGDGSHSFYIEELKEHYHSIHGAIQESKHVFIEAGFNYACELIAAFGKKNISVLEIGLGTGLNTFLTIIENLRLHHCVSYAAVEAFPLSPEMLAGLNYASLLSADMDSSGFQNIFNTIHLSPWNRKIVLNEMFNLTKINDTLQRVQFQETFDLVYFDAFGPVVQPEMWTEEMFFKIANAMNNKGVLVTYCAKGNVKRILKQVGFTVEALQGPPGKREMIRAIK
ncbi:MAG TPA: tRNA (5-methylaminomethyl-2-thiouridine)(34)-methyltransferase MnmD [Bacteroidia bacterium]|nr:tRNA (5-methylaminomethyl-2-thiouridine)(34)-methyltransferase MnmD [Bacteroidia bacterium]